MKKERGRAARVFQARDTPLRRILQGSLFSRKGKGNCMKDYERAIAPAILFEEQHAFREAAVRRSYLVKIEAGRQQ
jgi:hypothetical protein